MSSLLNQHQVLYECLLDCNGDIEAAFVAAEQILSTREHIPYTTAPITPATSIQLSAPTSLDVRAIEIMKRVIGKGLSFLLGKQR